jgi:flagellar motor switch protein FliN
MSTAVEVDTQKALIIDADAARGGKLSDVLKNCGYAPATAEDPMSAQMLVDSEPFDVVLCQEKLNGATIIDVLKMLRPAHPNLPLIVLSSDPKSLLIAEALKEGASDSFTTPDDVAALYPKLAAIQSKAAKAPAHELAPKTVVNPVALPELHPAKLAGEPGNVDMILDVPVTLNAILGNANMKIADLLQLGPGSVIELDKRAGEPVDLYIDDKLVALGEVVVVNETFGVRITEVIDPRQRVQALA